MTIPIPNGRASHKDASVRDLAAATFRQAVHVARDSRLLKGLPTGAVEDGVHAAKRALKTAQRGLERASDIRDEVARRAKREPMKTIGVAFGGGLLLGAIVGFASGFGFTKSAPDHAQVTE